jgi:hypothetical protein
MRIDAGQLDPAAVHVVDLIEQAGTRAGPSHTLRRFATNLRQILSPLNE